jgi:transcriptional regulator with XRE-family HTH domain
MGWIPDKCLIPELLHKIGKSQRWLANKVGDSESQVSQYVIMYRIMNLQTAKRYAEALNCLIDDLYIWRFKKE